MIITKQFLPLFIISLLLSACSSTSNQAFVIDPPSESQIENSVKQQVALTLNAFTPVAGQALPNNTVLEAYQARGYEPMWIKDKKINMSIYKLLDILEQSYTHGLNPIHYHTDIIKEYLALKQPTPQQLAEMDVITTIALTSYAHDLSNGRYEPQLIDPNWQLDAPNNNWRDLLYIDSATDMVNSLPLLAPRSPQYQILQKWLVYYQDLARKEKDIFVNAGVPLSAGDEGPRVAQLRARLVQLGDIRFSTRKVNEEQFDLRLKDALMRFQQRHHLSADGAAGSKTIEMLNVPLETRAKQIAYNLERWRWLPSELEANRIWVDLTNYTMEMNLNGELTSMKVVIGKPERKTPVFKGLMTYMVTNPTWRVPHRIARENLLPKLQADPNYLVKHGYKLYSSWSIGAKELDSTKINWKAISEDKLAFRFEQEPDEGNALGQYKFMFPNKNEIYLHDTPAKHLFRETNRAFSSGCVRLENPNEFAKEITKGYKQFNEMNKTLKTASNSVISLPTYIPVYLVYFTVVPNANGMLEFRDDIYQRDPLMEEAMGYSAFNARESI
ncbi:L,D-transpeptidase family protein [Marinomonas sp. M1K-6]|uniref:L,D-transpeptidase family protein n=1 Tax=Marinomonas profundi TaxID=2726122 RepID=A0A847R7L8_9GAMM|nr:L,D-transpeptidase family protein [Marinomonas profundi]NLQ16934.1 L,D-transpeptidase family protein [Marinomonas profundi]UDV02663.1 L,D-transpeptidase family protein [Marinomonas profundi]